MRKVVGLLVCLSVLLSSSVSFAYTVEIKEYIPEEYLLFVVYGADPNKPVDEEAIRKFIYSTNPPYTTQLHIAVYEKGKNFGEGMYALLGRYAGMRDWHTIRERKKPLAEEYELGFSIAFQSLLSKYTEDPLAVKALYANKTLSLYMKINRIGSDSKGNPYVEAELKDKGCSLIARAYLSKGDPFLAKHQLGDTIGVHGRVTSFSDTMLTLKGKVIDW